MLPRTSRGLEFLAVLFCETLVECNFGENHNQGELTSKRGQEMNEGKYDFLDMETKAIEGKRAVYLACATTML